MSISSEIRGTLQVRAMTADGFPAAGQIDFEGQFFTPTLGTPWARMTLMPGTERPDHVGNELVRHEGLFQVDVFRPTSGGAGTKPIEELADAVKNVFHSGTRLPTTSGRRLLVRYSERTQVLNQPDWFQISVTIGYRLYAPL